MGLPKLEHPTFELEVPSTKEVVKYRPFLVKEEKILLIAQQSGEPKDFISAIQQVLNNCMMDYDCTNATNFDTEYMFLKLRANSVSDLAKIMVVDEETDEDVEVEVDLNEVEVKMPEEVNNLVNLNDDVSVELRWPRYTDILKMQDIDNDDATTDLVAMCIDRVYNGEEVLDMKDFTKEEQDEFINSFPADAFMTIQEYFENMPKVSQEIKYKIKTEEGKQKTKKKLLEGIEDFF